MLSHGEKFLLTHCRSEEDLTESLAFVIQSYLNSIRIQVQTLKRLSRALQEVSSSAEDETIAVSRLVDETRSYFSSQEQMDRYRIDTRVSVGKALEEARLAARVSYRHQNDDPEKKVV